LRPPFSDEGYASELIAFCITEARHLRLCAKLTAFAHSEDLASQKVLTRAGFVAERFVPEMARWLYGLEIAG
jgi:RimJ/RimL family protein N-acetyltransferase